MLNIEIPPTLKKQLLDDCEFVTHLGKVRQSLSFIYLIKLFTCFSLNFIV